MCIGVSRSFGSFPAHSQKCLALIDLLMKLFDSPKAPFRGIIFVEQISMTFPLSVVVNDAFSKIRDALFVEGEHIDDRTPWPARPVSGGSSMSEVLRNATLNAFRLGDAPLLVSTAALEEGVDVQECSFVIRFDHLHTTKAHIQGSGRARMADADIYYFENDPREECLKATTMEEVARNKSLNLATSALQRCNLARVQSEAAVSRVIRYPFTPPGASSSLAEVNFFNCVPILYQYVQGVMGQSISPEECLFDFEVECVREMPPEYVKTLVSVSVPTPNGVIILRQSDFNFFWNSLEMEDIIKPPERLKNMTTMDITIRRAVYVAVLRLHDMGFLTPMNKPSGIAKAETKNKCSVYMNKDKMQLRNQFAETSMSSAIPAMTFDDCDEAV